MSDTPNVAQTRAVTLVYITAVLDEIAAAEARFRAELAAIRAKYLGDLDADDPFRLLLSVATRLSPGDVSFRAGNGSPS